MDACKYWATHVMTSAERINKVLLYSRDDQTFAQTIEEYISTRKDVGFNKQQTISMPWIHITLQKISPEHTFQTSNWVMSLFQYLTPTPTNRESAVAPCFIRDVLSMKENNSIVVGIDVTNKLTLYTIDDHTAVIECIYYHTLPYMDWKEQCNHLRPLPPPPATAIGYTVEVISKRLVRRPTINGNMPKTIVELHKSKYAVAKPSKIPAALLNPLKWPLPEPCSPLVHSMTSKPSNFLVPGSIDPPMFRHPSQLCTADLTDKTFQSYLKHYMQHRIGNVHHIDEGLLSSPPDPQPIQTHRMDTPHDLPGQVSASPAFTLSHLCRVPELALLASQVTNAETRWRTQSDADAKQAGPAQKSSLNACSCLSTTTHMKMKHLFMWAVLNLYKQGSIVLCDRPFSLPSDFVPVSSPMFSSHHLSSAKCIVLKRMSTSQIHQCIRRTRPMFL
ncbi:hypothetical protein F4604DRAFT_1680591 [Suillus subluteus]|nr:hypothetical protein F4604DRAFT_1680591 [Suillus subluteus]